jgi:hypothetical protein
VSRYLFSDRRIEGEAVLGEPTALFFQVELRWPPPELVSFRVSHTLVRALFNKLFEPEYSEFAYQNLELEPRRPTLSRQSGNARSVLQFDSSSLTIEESKSESHLNQFEKHIAAVLRALASVATGLEVEVPEFFLQRCKIQCLAQPYNSTGSLPLLAGGVANVLERIDPFERPPCHFGVRFRFPPAEIVDQEGEEGEEGEVRTHRNFATVRFETYEADPAMVWMEVASEYMLYPNEIALADDRKITAHVQETYDFLTQQCVHFLNQFDIELPGGRQQDGESES